MNDLFDDHIGDALHRAAAAMPGRSPGFGDVRRRVRHRRRVQTGLAAVPVVAVGGLLGLRHSPVAVPLTPGAIGPDSTSDPSGGNPLSDCYVTVATTIDPRLLEPTDMGHDQTTTIGTLPASSTSELTTPPTILPELATTYIGDIADMTVAGEPTSSIGGEPTLSTATQPTLSNFGVPSTTIPCDSTVPTIDIGVLATSTLPPCTNLSDCGPVSAVPDAWSSAVNFAGTSFAISSVEDTPDAFCQYFDGQLSGCDGGFEGYGAIASWLRSADNTEVYVFGVAAPGVRVIFTIPDSSIRSIREATYGDGDWRIAWAISLPASAVEVGAVLSLFPEGSEPGTFGTPETISLDDIARTVDDLPVTYPATTTTSI